MCVTPFSLTYSSPGRVVAMLPPFSAAKSTTTEPRFIDATIAAEMSLGAGLPGMSAVVMMMSTSLAILAKSAISASMKAGLISLA